MAQLYVSDSTFGQYREVYGESAKDEMRQVLELNAPDPEDDHAE